MDSESVQRDKKRRCALKTFNAFLNEANLVFSVWKDFSQSNPITKDIYGQYLSFLVVKCKT